MSKMVLTALVFLAGLNAQANILITARTDIKINAHSNETDIGFGCIMTHDVSSDPRLLRKDAILKVTLAENFSPILRDAAVDMGVSLSQASQIKTYQQLKKLGAGIGVAVPTAEELYNNHYDMEKVGTIAYQSVTGKTPSADQIKSYMALSVALEEVGARLPQAESLITFKKLHLSMRSGKTEKLVSLQCLIAPETLEESLDLLNSTPVFSVINNPDDL